MERITRIEHKFISESERAKLPQTKRLVPYYHVFWGAKESMYKAYGEKELDFRKHMHVYPFRIYHKQTNFSGYINKSKLYQAYNLHYENIKENYLVYCQIKEDEKV